MSIDNPGNFFNADSFPEDENEDSKEPIKIYGNELFKKSIDILNITQTICDLLPEDDDNISPVSIKNMMMHNALMVPSLIKGAMAVDDTYSHVMENAVIIKVNIMELRDQLWACENLEDIEVKYLDVLEKEIDTFKGIFIQWVSCFDKSSDFPDEWHLFNNPGDFPEDDEPFDGEDFLNDADTDDI